MKIVDYSEPHGTFAAGGGKCPHKKKQTNTAFSPMEGKMPTQEKNKHGIFAAGGAKAPTQEKKKTNKWVTHIFNIYAL